MDDDPLHRSISYLLASSMRPLAVVSDITARLAEGGELVVTVGDVMQQLQQALGATEVSLWLHASDGLRRSAAAGDPSLSVDEVRRAVTYLRWKAGDADDIAPSLFAGRARRKSADDEIVPVVAAPNGAAPIGPGLPGNPPFVSS